MPTETIYDHPLYYDILFGWDRSEEAGFYESAFRHYGVPPDARVLEVACGTGAVGRRLAHRGWAVSGIDLSEAMVAFLLDAAKREGIHVDARVADMTRFRAESPFGAAFNPMSSLRVLATDADLDAHLSCVAEALRIGGVYVLDLDLAADADAPAITTDEDWEMERDGVTVRATADAVHVVVGGTERVLGWAEGGADAHLRALSCTALCERVARSGAFRVAGWHPEVRGAEDELSRFRVDVETAPPVVGRTMVVLRRE